MAPDDPLPLGLPGTGPREPVESAVAHAQHWLRFLPHAEPAFAWVHVALPESPDELERAEAIAELDRLLGLLFAEAQLRGRHRQVEPVVVVTALSGLAPDDDHSKAFVLADESVRSQAILSGSGETAGIEDGLIPLTSLHGSLARVARGEEPAVPAAAGEAVLAETFLPMTALGAEPRMRAVRAPGAAAPPEPDPVAVQALAGDPGWPSSFSGPAPEVALDEWRRLEQARRELQAGRPEPAQALLEGLLEQAGERARAAALLLGLAEIESGRPEEASRRLRGLADALPPANPTRRLALLALARAEVAAGRAAAGRQVLTGLAEERPDDVDALVQLASLSDQSGDLAGALAALGRALEASPEDPRVLTFVARVHLARGRPEAASAAYGDALARRPVDHALLFEGAEAALQAGDYWTALDRLNKHVLAYGETADASFGMGRVFAAEGRWRSAGAHFSQALELDEGHHRARVALGEALLRSGNEKDGRAVLLAADARHRESSLPCLSLIAWLQDEGRLDEARTELERCRARHAGDGELARLAEALGAP
jgi:tetratricopeptide (TPR) repeat protein